MQSMGKLTPEEFWARYEETDAAVRDSFPSGPLFGLRDWSGPATLGEWMLASADRRGVDYAFADGRPAVRVHTDPGPLHDLPPRLQLVFPAEGDQLRSSEIVRPADQIVDMDVDGVPVVFRLWQELAGWWALGELGAHVIVVESVAPEPAQLRVARVLDIEPLLSTRREHVRRLRGEN
jgi:hypothetical protein